MVKKLLLPIHLIKSVTEAAIDEVAYAVTLINNMWTDASLENGKLYTITNDEELINYVESNKQVGDFNRKFVKIQSKGYIKVTSNVDTICFKNHDEPIAEKVAPTSRENTVDIAEGVGYYPAEIVEWNSVKSLVESKFLKIGKIVDKPFLANKKL